MATIKDIAEMANVSMMTVSRAFNKPEQVKEEVRTRIMEIAEQLRYVPNQAAKSLATNKTGIIQIITKMNSYEYYFTQLFAGVADHLSLSGYSIMINREYSLNFKCDGAIYMGLEIGQDHTIFEEINVPAVLFGKTDMPVDWLDIDNVDGSYQVTKHLIDKGHKVLAYFGVQSHEAYCIERYNGFDHAMKEAGNVTTPKLYFSTTHDMLEAKEEAKHVLQTMMDEKATGVVCATDMLAYCIIDVAKTMGIEVPKQISVVGFDGFLFNTMSNPHITTVVQPVYKMGMDLADMIIDRLKYPDSAPKRIVVGTTLLEGESVGKMI